MPKNRVPASAPNRPSTTAIGREAEARVASEYEKHGFAVLGRNVRVGPLELDLVLEKNGLCVICEVRFRASTERGHPAATVDIAKRRRIRAAAAGWLAAQADIGVHTIRFDVVTIVGRGESARLALYPNAF